MLCTRELRKVFFFNINFFQIVSCSMHKILIFLKIQNAFSLRWFFLAYQTRLSAIFTSADKTYLTYPYLTYGMLNGDPRTDFSTRTSHPWKIFIFLTFKLAKLFCYAILDISSREHGSNKQVASKSCALSLVRQLYHMKVIEAYTGQIKKKEGDKVNENPFSKSHRTDKS